MPRFAVQCMVATYDQTVVIVEAESLKDACVKGIETARTQGKCVAQNPSDDPLDDIYNGSLEIPIRYSENGIGRDWT